MLCPQSLVLSLNVNRKCSSESPSSSMASSSTEPAGMKRNDIAIQIEAMLKAIKAEAPVKTEHSIYKVPDQIRKLNKDAYTPKVVSIGPFHLSSENIPEMEIYKKIYFNEFLKRSQTNLDGLVSLVEELEPRLRGCYSENIECSKEEFVKMILVDAGFILELVYLLYYLGECTKDDALLGKWWLIDDIMEDLFLLENQLPFSVLKELYELAHPTPQGGKLPSFHDLTSGVLIYRDRQMLVPKSTPMLHFTDLLRESYLQTSCGRLQPRGYGMITVRSATELYEIGVKFKADRTSQISQLDLRFSVDFKFLELCLPFLVSNGTLQIPEIIVNGGTGKLFRNMMALEHCHYPHESYITDYVFLLRCLIKTDEDADFLIKNRIIVNHLDSSNDVRRLFYSLGKSTAVVSSSSVYGEFCEHLNAFCDRPKRRWKATWRRDYYLDLKRNYCKTPLQTLATLGGILLIILTVIQTVCSILQVK